MRLVKVVQLAPPFTLSSVSVVAIRGYVAFAMAHIGGAVATQASIPEAAFAMVYVGGAVAVQTSVPNIVVCHNAGQSVPAVCTSPRLP